MKVYSSYAVMASLYTITNARHLVQTQPTVVVSLPPDGMSPRPTSPPNHRDLFRRQNDNEKDQYVLIAPDATCGYISGRPGASYDCGVSATCAFLSSPGGDGAVACCNTVECNARASCVDFNDYFSSSACGDGCEVDAYTLKCTNTADPYCNTISFSGGIQDFWCNNVNISTAQMASTTYKGQPDDRNFSTVALADLTSAISFASTGTVGDAPAVTGDPTVHSTANAATSEASATQIPDDGSSRTSVGTIAGGVVGGVCAAGLAGLAAFFILRRKKQKKVAAVTTHTAHKSPLMQQQQQPGVGAGDYSPVPQGAAGYDVPKAPYPAPGQQTGFRPGYQTQRAIIYEAGDESATSPLYELA